MRFSQSARRFASTCKSHRTRELNLAVSASVTLGCRLTCSPLPFVSPSDDHDLVIIGGGPGGYVSAIKAGQLGMNVSIARSGPPRPHRTAAFALVPSGSARFLNLALVFVTPRRST